MMSNFYKHTSVVTVQSFSSLNAERQQCKALQLDRPTYYTFYIIKSLSPDDRRSTQIWNVGLLQRDYIHFMFLQFWIYTVGFWKK
jgi:hypothetical protein